MELWASHSAASQRQLTGALAIHLEKMYFEGSITCSHFLIKFKPDETPICPHPRHASSLEGPEGASLCYSLQPPPAGFLLQHPGAHAPTSLCQSPRHRPRAGGRLCRRSQADSIWVPMWPPLQPEGRVSTRATCPLHHLFSAQGLLCQTVRSRGLILSVWCLLLQGRWSWLGGRVKEM